MDSKDFQTLMELYWACERILGREPRAGSAGPTLQMRGLQTATLISALQALTLLKQRIILLEEGAGLAASHPPTFAPELLEERVRQLERQLQEARSECERLRYDNASLQQQLCSRHHQGSAAGPCAAPCPALEALAVDARETQRQLQQLEQANACLFDRSMQLSMQLDESERCRCARCRWAGRPAGRRRRHASTGY
jgi:DNA repair exonuclease SbcCD ATPase subunit